MIIYTKVPKAASSTMKFLINDFSDENNYKAITPELQMWDSTEAEKTVRNYLFH